MDVVRVHCGDSYVLVEPIVPEELEKLLTYWHRSLEFDPNSNFPKKVAVGRSRKLYTLNPQVGPDGRMVNTLITMPGFVPAIQAKLIGLGLGVELIDERTPRPNYDMAAAMPGLRPFQFQCAYDAIWSGGGIIACPTGWGKCLAPSTPILYFDGSVKPISEVKVGARLMGDDSLPRTVLERIDGSGPMYRITPTKGEPFEVADDHVLCLVATDTNEKIEIKLSDYLSYSKTFKHRHKLYHVPVEFPEQAIKVDPYFLGLWLGDGDWQRPAITSGDVEIEFYLRALAANKGLQLKEDRRDGCSNYRLVGQKKRPNPITTAMREYGIMISREKRIPREFLVNTRSIRMLVLAGLLDSDGSLNAGTDFDWVNTNKALAEDVVFLARSLGFRVNYHSRQCRGFGKTVTAYRLRITGATHEIPTFIARKRASVRRQIKDCLRSGFTVTKVADGPYVGVRLDGNMRHLLGDFTVTHNTHIISAIIRAYSHQELCNRGTCLTVVITPGADLAKKNYHDLKAQLPGREVGLVGGGVQRFSDDVQVVTPESADNLNMDDVGLLFYDEVHTVSEARAEMIMRAKKALRYGLSATPFGRFDGSDKVIEGLFGPIVYQRTYAEAIADGAVVPLKVCWLDCPEPDGWRHYSTHDSNYRNGIWRNERLHALVGRLWTAIPADLQALAIVDKLEHMNGVVPQMNGVTYVHAQNSTKYFEGNNLSCNLQPVKDRQRDKIYEQMASGELKRVISTGIYRQGVNFPQLAVLVNLAGMKSDIIAGQLPGRTSRRIVGGKEYGVIVDFWHRWDVWEKRGRSVAGDLLRDDMNREKVYRQLGFEQAWMDLDALTKEMANV